MEHTGIPRTSRLSRLTRVLIPAMGGVALLVAGAVATADPGASGPRDPEGRLAAICAQLECTEDQKGELRTIFMELRQDTKSDREAIRTTHESLAREWAQDAPDEAAMEALESKIHAHRAALAGLVHDSMMEVHATLEPAQRAKLAKLIARRGFPGLHGPEGNADRRGGKPKD